MRFSQLKTFHAVARWGGFSNAAQKLNISQPAVSDHIKNLEETYGLQLFIRNKKSVELTQIGRKLFVLAEKMLETELAAQDLLTRASGLNEGHLVIGADAAVHILPVLSKFRAKYPNVQISVSTGNSKSLIARLERLEIDFAVVATNSISKIFVSYLLSQNTLSAMCAIDDSLADYKTISLKQLLKRPLVLREKGSETRKIFDKAALKIKHQSGKVIEVEGREAVREAVAAGLGIGIVSTAEYVDDSRLKMIHVNDLHEKMNEWIVCLKSRTKLHLISALLEIITSDERN